MLKTIVDVSQLLTNLVVIVAAICIISIFGSIDNYFALQAAKELKDYPILKRIDHQGRRTDPDLILFSSSEKPIFRINDIEIKMIYGGKERVINMEKDGGLWKVKSNNLAKHFESFELFDSPGLKTVGCIVEIKTNLGFLNEIAHEYKLEIETKGLSYEIKSFTY